MNSGLNHLLYQRTSSKNACDFCVPPTHHPSTIGDPDDPTLGTYVPFLSTEIFPSRYAYKFVPS